MRASTRDRRRALARRARALLERPRGRWIAGGLALTVAVALAVWLGRGPARVVAQRVLEPASLARVEALAPALLPAAEAEGLDPNLVAAICYVESRGKPDAVSSADALGLMQLTLASAADAARALGMEPPTRERLLEDPALNLRLGTRHLAWTYEHEERHLERALCAYNAGRGRLRGWIEAAGSYEAWRAKQLREGDSQVLAYALKVLDMAEVFRERGALDAAAAGVAGAGTPGG